MRLGGSQQQCVRRSAEAVVQPIYFKAGSRASTQAEVPDHLVFPDTLEYERGAGIQAIWLAAVSGARGATLRTKPHSEKLLWGTAADTPNPSQLAGCAME